MTIDEIRALQARLESHAEFLRDGCARPLGAFMAQNISNQITLAVEALDKAAELAYQNGRLWDRLWGWQQDAAARLMQYCDLTESGLIGEPTQVRVSLIAPTLSMLELDLLGLMAFDECGLCGADIRPGDRFAAIAFGDEHDAGEACSKCAPEHATFVKGEINLRAVVDSARAALTQENTP